MGIGQSANMKQLKDQEMRNPLMSGSCGPLREVRINRTYADRKDITETFNALHAEIKAEFDRILRGLSNTYGDGGVSACGHLEIIQYRIKNLMDRGLIHHLQTIVRDLHVGIFNDDKDATLPEKSKEGDDAT